MNVKIFNVSKTDENDLVTEVFQSKSIVVGSPTVNNTILSSVAGFIQLIKRLKFKDKKAASFGCYGWSGECTKILNELLSDAGFSLIDDEGFKVMWNPDEEKKNEAIEFGKKIAKA